MIAELKPRKPIHPPFAGTTQNEQITSILSGRKVSLFYSVRLIRLTLTTERAFLNGFKFDDAVYGYSNMLSKSNGLNGENLVRNGAKNHLITIFDKILSLYSLLKFFSLVIKLRGTTTSYIEKKGVLKKPAKFGTSLKALRRFFFYLIGGPPFKN